MPEWFTDGRKLAFVAGGFLLPTTVGAIWRIGALLLDLSMSRHGQVLFGLGALTSGVLEIAIVSAVPAFCFCLFRSDGARIEARYKVPLICAAFILSLSASQLLFQWFQVAAGSFAFAGVSNVLAASRDACFALLLWALSRSAGAQSSVTPASLVRVSRLAVVIFGVVTLLATTPYLYAAVTYVQDDGFSDPAILEQLRGSLLPGVWAFLRALAAIVAPFAVWRSTKVPQPVTDLLEDDEAL
jgi:hypothetical protein